MRIILSSVAIVVLGASVQAADLEFLLNPFGKPTFGPNPSGVLIRLTNLDPDEKITVQNTTFTAVNAGDLVNVEDAAIPTGCFDGNPGPAVQRENEADCADLFGAYRKKNDSWWGQYFTVHTGFEGITGGGTGDDQMGLNFGTGPFGDDPSDDPNSEGLPPFPPDPVNFFYGVIADRNRGEVDYHIELAISHGGAEDPDARVEMHDGTLSAVPEPSALALVVISCMSLLAVRRWRWAEWT